MDCALSVIPPASLTVLPDVARDPAHPRAPEGTMLEDHLGSLRAARRLRGSSASPFVDRFADQLHSLGYTAISADHRLVDLARYAEWVDKRGLEFSDDALAKLKARLRRSGQLHDRAGKTSTLLTTARQFTRYLEEIGAKEPSPRPSIADEYPIAGEFGAWLREHRGVQETTLCAYQDRLRGVFRALGGDPRRYTAARLREFVRREAPKCCLKTAQALVTALRAFVRFMIATGRRPRHLAHAIPSLSSWRLASIPRFLEPADLEKVVAACDGRARDRAVILLLARLGLRRSDVADLRIKDIDWAEGRLAVAGKSRRREWLPLPQEVGKALLHYLRSGRPALASDHVFGMAVAPVRPISRYAVTHIARGAIRRAGVPAPARGAAHVLRHSAATAMLRNGASIESIRAVLRHTSPDTTAYYAKIDFDRLRELAQPWPTEAP